MVQSIDFERVIVPYIEDHTSNFRSAHMIGYDRFG
jgi:hypothetical protein